MMRKPVRGAAREARHTARVFGSTHARRTACVRPRGRRARPLRHTCRRLFALTGDVDILVSWRPIPLRHAEACAVGRCRESTALAPLALKTPISGRTVMTAAFKA
ncbi:hypothetical protein EVAR_83201_1 [Eumeta japonica]|uniref:Uncharacterized protein n=1 Tax=Eumeta variegata TaxID=151549 RepID=A0A4C1YSI8_EUMVA|nr:hypothetical protein EVAR_83201_1 [Eumeta japonica]